MQKTLLKNKKGEVSFVFIAVLLFSLLIFFYIGDKKTALVLFVGYILFKIIFNFIRRKRNDTNTYY